MGAIESQLHAAITAYLARGDEAIHSLQSGDPDHALRVLTWRKAAFHNFRVALMRAETESCRVSSKTWPGISQKIADQDATLARLIRDESLKTSKQLILIHREKTRIRKFRADREHSGQFCQAV
ncbi:MAG: hypothetical protein H6618_00700 [Deltaproteobacteria bacterium]|nr:hypothetical protein [Deltaproteobacteria bacterium]